MIFGLHSTSVSGPLSAYNDPCLGSTQSGAGLGAYSRQERHAMRCR